MNTEELKSEIRNLKRNLIIEKEKAAFWRNSAYSLQIQLEYCTGNNGDLLRPEHSKSFKAMIEAELKSEGL